MIVDTFLTGTLNPNHPPCQDYIAYTEEKNQINIALSDGCSGSKDTDIGARIITQKYLHTLKSKLYDEKEITINIKWLYEEALRIGRGIGLKDNSFIDCTLLTITANNSHATAYLYGDGIIITKYKYSNAIWIQNIESIPGIDGNIFPIYPSYFIGGKEQYLERLINYNSNKVNKQTEILHNEDIKISTIIEITKENYAPIKVETTEYEFMIIASDGLKSFTRKNDQGNIELVPLTEVIEEITNIKVWSDGFLRRRMNKFLSTTSWENRDDISIGMVYYGGNNSI